VYILELHPYEDYGERKYMKGLHMVAFLLVVVGALNWGLVGLLNMNLVTLLVGSWPMLEKLVYILVGVSGVYLLVTHKADCKICSKM
jgi:uncharacterized membrane protein YuzA (DUF378 family)